MEGFFNSYKSIPSLFSRLIFAASPYASCPVFSFGTQSYICNTTLVDLDAILITTVLSYHVINGNVRSTDLTTGTLPTLGGDVELDATNLTMTGQYERPNKTVT